MELQLEVEDDLRGNICLKRSSRQPFGLELEVLFELLEEIEG